jgi:hypothetical protein
VLSYRVILTVPSLYMEVRRGSAASEVQYRVDRCCQVQPYWIKTPTPRAIVAAAGMRPRQADPLRSAEQ